MRCCIGTIENIKQEDARVHFEIRERVTVLEEHIMECVTAPRFTGEIPPAGSLVEADAEDQSNRTELSVTHIEVLERATKRGTKELFRLEDGSSEIRPSNAQPF